jgi:filamentous hemagglutinin
MIDRYGYPGGSYLSPRGTPFGERGLPAYYENTKPNYQYKVAQPVTVRGGTVAPAFGGDGGGVQYQFGTSVQDLLDSGVLKRVGP